MGKDFISSMPNEIIAMILTLLTLKEARRTSILSRRWKNLWTFFSGFLIFDNSMKTLQMCRDRKTLKLKKCTHFVNEWEKLMSNLEHVLRSLTSPSLEGLRICIDMGNPQKLADLIKFAADKSVRVLDLDFSYHFISTFIGVSDSIRNVLSPTIVQMQSLRSLRVLRLAAVDVDGEAIHYFLASCPYLEILFIKESRILEHLRVWGHGLRLKHLEFNCFQKIETFNFEWIPSLTEASFGGQYGCYLQSNMHDIVVHQLLSQLLVLNLELRAFDMTFLEGLPKFTNVKHLELTIPHVCGMELDRPISLLTAFPSIYLLKLKFYRSRLGPLPMQPWVANLECEFPNLKELEVSGYRRDPSQIEMLTTIFENAPNLKKIAVDPLSPIHVHRSNDVKAWIRESNHETTIWFVDGLKQYVPPHVELLVL
ncbi:hypothetical protein Lal_00019570 [Lupinus albus]|uniref:Putative F-box domain, leucine-rich repeat domain, L domain-containing protein n=1 Tax=Lupinus albus TaxID=3870 RepID=A0A6A5PR58_LUPAL|nr:putative F-box domain, leucine-rich repeat domain, L domain-containing protein [Lupinus albus]KAF1899442.1 hypothetical protein Lal_00019570 [Lupinus albus]